MSYYIYKICCDDCPDFIYVGSTKAFRQRKNQHKNCYNKEHPQKVYTTIRENGGWDNWRMVILEDCGEITLTEVRIKEEEYRVKLNADLNERKCKGDKKEYDKEYKKNNEKYKQNQREYANQRITCECGMELRVGNKARHEKSKIHKKLIEEKNNI